MIKKIQKNKKGFVMLFAVTVSSILLAIALGISSIALKEIKFGTNARDTNDAFFAADTGVECALFFDKSSANAFTGGVPMNCAGATITIVQSPASVWNFIISGLGSMGQSCAKVTVDKKSLSPKTLITSKGYNVGSADGLCASSSANLVERQLLVTY